MHQCKYFTYPQPRLQQHHPDTLPSFLARIRHIILRDSTTHRLRPVVVEVIMEMSITSAEAQTLEEERVVVQGQRVEDIEVGLGKLKKLVR